MKNNKGFSLVELIIVIAIMAILVGVIAPQL
ncbi:MAG: prepilin-type N-terminal cleavage/methylation domain-containing protein, partial [Lachnospiraceae bacterium]|nr:prepilin-type N-terminal cleavage/methylation domain-containing protein [Lachnospiraceae bacterium]